MAADLAQRRAPDDPDPGALGRRDVLRRAREDPIVLAIALLVLFLAARTSECSSNSLG